MDIKDLGKLVEHFRAVRVMSPLMFEQTMREYREMAKGGDGGPSGGTGSKSIREQYYRGYSDWVFQTVLEELGKTEDV